MSEDKVAVMQVVEQPGTVVLVAACVGREFSTRLSDCCLDMPVCCCGWCCPLCLTASIAERTGEPCHKCVGCCLFPESVAMLRLKLRTQHGIKGSICTDLACGLCCPLYTLCQLEREMKFLGM